jgi:hypothetical protein
VKSKKTRDGGAGIAKLLMNANLPCGNQRGLCHQENQPTGKNDGMKNKERWQMKLRKEAIQKKSAGESRENDCGGQNGDKEIETAIAKTRG